MIKWDEVVEGRFINLGEGGEWAKDCIEIDHTLRIRFMDSDHQACLDDDWDKIWEIYYRKKLAEGQVDRTAKGVATAHKNEIRMFYTDDKSVLWFAFYKGQMWWCFANPVVTELEDRTKTRPAIGGWRNTSLDDRPLEFSELDAEIQEVKGFLRTIRRIDGELLEVVKSAILGEGTSSESSVTTKSVVLDDAGYFDADDDEDERDKRLTEIAQRRGQGDFRKALLLAYQGECVVTGCDAQQALEAAHIIRYRGKKSNQVTNGLLLRADIHTLFDLNLLAICPDDLSLRVSPQLEGTVYDELDGTPIRPPALARHRPDRKTLRKRWNLFVAE